MSAYATTAPALQPPAGFRRFGLGFYDAAVLTWRNLLRTLRNPAYLATEIIIQPLLFTLLFAFVFGGAIQTPGTSYINFLMPGIFVQTIVFGSLNTAIGLTEDLEKGLMDRFRALPIARWAVVLGRVLSDMVLDLTSLVTMIVVGYLIGFRFGGTAAETAAALGLIFLFGFSISCLGALLGTILRTPQMVQAIGFVVIFPLTFASSTFVPVQTMPDWLQAFAAHTPVTAVVTAVRNLVLGSPAALDYTSAVLWPLAIIAISVPAAAYFFRRQTH
jgi:ABC-2 type transport system permease protein/oleandomycin transport system permease protein